MKINSDTKISKIIAHNPQAIDAIAAINPHFNKLRNPLLRKLLAPRVSIADAARIGKCTVSEFFTALQSIGFLIEDFPESDSSFNEFKNYEIAEAIKAGDVITLDVRPILESGKDPFKDIMEKIAAVPEHMVLEIVNTFEPVPLIGILARKGYVSYVEVKNTTVHTFFIKAREVKPEPEGEHLFRVTNDQIHLKMSTYGKRCKELDVRDLDMPMPMVTILEKLDTLAENEALYVYHKKIPQYLLPELKERGYTIWISEGGQEQFRLLIFK